MTTAPPAIGPATLRRCWCGKFYAPGWRDRQRHQDLWGHKPEPPRPEHQHHGLSPQCESDHHWTCGGGYVEAGSARACTCTCGHPDDAPRGAAARRALAALNGQEPPAAPAPEPGLEQRSWYCARGSHGRCRGIRYATTGHGTKPCECACHTTTDGRAA